MHFAGKMQQHLRSFQAASEDNETVSGEVLAAVTATVVRLRSATRGQDRAAAVLAHNT